MVSREQIFAALFARLQSVSGLVTSSRVLKHWNDVSPEQQPIGMQMEGRQTAEPHPHSGTKWTFHAEWYLYVHQQNASGDVVQLLNTIVDACGAALDPGPAFEAQTLGNLVTDCRISGDIETSEGRLGEQAVAIIPLLIIANA